jgi:hypothetical protein
MESVITLIKRPYPRNWSGNPVIYKFYSDDAKNDIDIIFEVRIVFKTAAFSAAYVTLAPIPLTPVEGMAALDISQILHAQMDYTVPGLGGGFVTESTKQSGIFYIEYREYNFNTSVAGPWITTEQLSTREIFKGGIHPFLWQANNYWLTYYNTRFPFLTWQKNGRLAGPDESLYLAWLNLFPTPNGNIQAFIRVTYIDGTSVDTNYLINGFSNRVYLLAAGIKQLNLTALQPTKTIWYWTLTVHDTTVPATPVALSETFKFHADFRKDYNHTVLHYRNSLGGLDSVRIRGVIETVVNLEGSDSETAAAPDWFYTTPLPRFDTSLPHREMPMYKGDIGHLEKNEQDTLRDAFLNREIWMEKNGRWWPVKLLSKQYRLRATIDKRFTLPIEWMLADAGSFFYTPDNVDMGSGTLLDNVCAAIVIPGGAVSTYAGDNLTASVNWTYTVNNPGAEAVLKVQWMIPGFQDNWQDLAYPGTGSLVTVHPVPSHPVLYMRAVCSGGSAGDVAIQGLSVPTPIEEEDPPPPPVNNSSIQNGTSQDTPYRVLVVGSLTDEGSISAFETKYFHTADINTPVAVRVELDFVHPSTIDLVTDGVLYTPAYTLGSNVWVFNVLKIENGIQIFFS